MIESVTPSHPSPRPPSRCERSFWVQRLSTIATFFCLGLFVGPLGAEVGTLSDVDITEAIETQFVVQKGVPFDDIDVVTEDGVVTLNGNVQHVLAKERASEIASAVRDVVGVVNRITVVPASRSDATIRDEIRQALFRNPATDGYEVQVFVEDGKVALKGWVESAREKKLVETVSKGVAGVTGVANGIEVRPSERRSAAEIKDEIEETFRWDIWVDEALIAVDVSDDGRVALAGVVGSAVEKSRAIELSRVEGVVRVTANDLEVDPLVDRERLRSDKPAAREDDDVRAAIERVFQQDPRVRPFHPEVRVRDGIVTLRGVVNQLNQKRVAEEDSLGVAGVWHVRNLLKVKPGEPLTDSETRENVLFALRLDPYVHRRDIEIQVHRGEVRLEGTVGSDFEKERAESAASTAAGVVAIHNDLRVSDEGRNTGKSDWAIKEDVEQELAWSPFVDAEQIRVTVEDGVATLSGQVDTWMEWKSAEENALEGGASDVHNRLQVRFGPENRRPTTS